jgi:cytochrome c oxidase subunit 2
MSQVAHEVDKIFIFIVGISVLLLAGVTAAMIYFVIRYRAKKNPKPENITGSTTLEIVWTVIPLILVLAMFYYGWQGFKLMRNVPPDAMTVKVTGRMWQWSFEYSNNKKSDSLYVPVGKPVKMEIQSADVNHSFYIPAFRIKEDAVPGRTNYLWFLADEIGRYDIMCAEYCGMNHAYMLNKIIALPEEEFNKWLNTPQDTLKTDSVKLDSIKTFLQKDTLKK